MEKIPTAEEFLNENWQNGIALYDYMIRFAKLHVKAALEAAANSRVNMGMNEPFTADEQYEILNAYPLENIK